MILLGSSDLGALKYLSLFNNFNTLDKYWITDKKKINFLKNKKLNVIKDINKTKGIKLAISGTSLGNSVDKKIIRFAKKNNIYCISVIEHWTNFKNRFYYKNKYLFPDIIFVNDKIAYKSAIKSGIPKNKLSIMGNLYLENLSKNKKRKKLSPWATKLIKNNKRIFIFISEDICKDKRLLRYEYKYDEFQTLDLIKKNLETDDLLIIKCHPDEKIDKFNKYKSKKIIVKKKINFNDLIYMPNKIIGMKSMLLLEIAIFRKDVISFRPIVDKPFIGEKFGATRLVRKNFKKNINKKIINKSIFFKKSFQGSNQRVKNFINKILKVL